MMCIVVFLGKAHPLYPFLLLNNRDEYHNRATKEVSWWEDGDILARKDEVARGTWLGCSRDGRLTFLTNVLELQSLPEARSRGDLSLLFLKSTKSPREFMEGLKKEGHCYNGFNLIVADIGSKSMVYITNRPKGEGITVEEVGAGLHVLSNAKLDSPWHKARRLRLRFIQEVSEYGDGEIPVKPLIDMVMMDTVKAQEAQLPHIYALDWELQLSSIFIQVHTPLGIYRTQSTSALTVTSSGEFSFYEAYLDNYNLWKNHLFEFCIQKLK